jgi:hypothetical protein
MESEASDWMQQSSIDEADWPTKEKENIESLNSRFQTQSGVNPTHGRFHVSYSSSQNVHETIEHVDPQNIEFKRALVKSSSTRKVRNLHSLVMIHVVRQTFIRTSLR